MSSPADSALAIRGDAGALKNHSLVIRLVPLLFLSQTFAMVRRFSHPIAALLLGLAFALSVTLSVAQAAAMSAQMETMPGMDMGGHQDCGGCTGTTDKDGMKNAVCVQFCLPALAAILPAELALARVVSTIGVASGQSSELSWMSAPNPSPPRS